MNILSLLVLCCKNNPSVGLIKKQHLDAFHKICIARTRIITLKLSFQHFRASLKTFFT